MAVEAGGRGDAKSTRTWSYCGVRGVATPGHSVNTEKSGRGPEEFTSPFRHQSVTSTGAGRRGHALVLYQFR
jgi:hypothetical protein